MSQSLLRQARSGQRRAWCRQQGSGAGFQNRGVNKLASFLKPCKKCGVEFIGRYCKPCDKARSAAWKKANPKKAAERASEWNRKNPDRRKDIVRKWNASNTSKIKEYRGSIRDRVLAYKQKYKRRQTEIITDVYVMNFFKGISRKYVSAELLDLKRVQLRIYRKIKDIK